MGDIRGSYKSHKQVGNRPITEKMCSCCSVIRSIKSFERSRDICMACRKREYRARRAENTKKISEIMSKY